ncbi:MAG: DUF58 domain-containing protein [Candidatus Cloacimonadota bacterium]|nr:MAG: DUF58 domain-containing protein [Candidatus Cloacimonadota bacterium]
MRKELLTDKAIAAADKFNLRAKLIVEGFIIGLHRSPFHGFSVEFSDHRQYIPGDSLKNLDWKIFGKTGKYYIKRYEEETNLKSYILLDCSNSMGFSSGNISKLNYGKMLASSLSYLMLKQQDAVGTLIFSDAVDDYIVAKARRSYLNILMNKFYETKPNGKTNTAEVLHSLAERIQKRGLIILITDLLDDPEKLMNGLRHFRYLKHEVIVFHLIDKEEIEFNYKKETEFIDSETKEKVVVNPWQIRKQYIDSFKDFTDKITGECLKSNIEYNQINTSVPIEQNLLAYFIKRSKLM